MAAVYVNNQAVIEAIYNTNQSRIEGVGDNLEEAIHDRLSEEAIYQGSNALANFMLYPIDIETYSYNRSSPRARVLDANIGYNQRWLYPLVGSNKEFPFRHTSPLGDEYNPKDYRAMVNEGNWVSICNFNAPEWADSYGYWDSTMNDMGDIVYKVLKESGIPIIEKY